MILLQLENGKRYAHTSTSGYQITMASIQPSSLRAPNCACNMINNPDDRSDRDDRVIVIVEHDLKEHVLCILDKKKLSQCKLDLVIKPGEQVAFKAIGKSQVLLTGSIT